jgi:hypothetical protein
VKEKDFTDFLNFRELSERAIRETCLIGISQWHTIRLVKFGTGQLRQVSWRKVGAPANLQLINAAHDKPQRVSRLKLKDCLELVDKLANHRVARQFFEGLVRDQERLYPAVAEQTQEDDI